MSSAAQRAKRREEVDYVYGERTKAAAWGGLKYGLAGAAVLTLGHYMSQIVRRQTLALKGFIFQLFTICNLNIRKVL
ncbi:hypothetical protein PNOK_0337100 [Pyrrhoderma noxium]|uniref:Uncharacterized protein n=1 Tax=Pyrrhoderma noxium TaxID=2282107 RepID=A0A286UMM4_9AGAM|nr:hypothetical protein PNOK_0337100 [Pyrrhoderma noxium]